VPGRFGSALFERAARAASGFDAVGVGEDDAVALVLRNDFAFFEAAMGASLVGAYAVPVNWHFMADEAGYVIEDCRARVVVVHADLLPQVRPASRPAWRSSWCRPRPRSETRTACPRMRPPCRPARCAGTNGSRDIRPGRGRLARPART
jgi:acyl-CoA synthetase (AMP-forming)/AMP-acid ligase II